MHLVLQSEGPASRECRCPQLLLVLVPREMPPDGFPSGMMEFSPSIARPMLECQPQGPDSDTREEINWVERPAPPGRRWDRAPGTLDPASKEDSQGPSFAMAEPGINLDGKGRMHLVLQSEGPARGRRGPEVRLQFGPGGQIFQSQPSAGEPRPAKNGASRARLSALLPGEEMPPELGLGVHQDVVPIHPHYIRSA